MLLREFHDTPSAGHGGIKKMLVGLAALFYWKGMRKSVKDYIKCCLVCQQTKYSTQAPPKSPKGGFPGGYLQPLPTPTAVWEDVSMDFITGLPNSKGVTVIFVVVDRFTKYAHFGTLPMNFNAHKVAEVGDMVLVKLQPYLQLTLAKRLSNKLAKRYYGPYEVMERIGKNGEPTRQILVQWAGGSPEEATWEWLSEFQEAYPSYNLEDKVAFEERRTVTPAVTSVAYKKKGRTARVKKVPGWQKDFLMG
ncbi:ty3-gypsy retrotransposon protein [Tanacetum coccineum]